MKPFIKSVLREELDKLIKCKSCGWSWKKSEGGPDMYFCHKCGTDNTPDNIKESENLIQAVGVLIQAKDTGRFLMLLRNDKKPSWSLVSGGLNKGEDAIEGLKREIQEELSVDPNLIELKFEYSEKTPNQNVMFNYYKGFTLTEFSPKLDNENLEWGWFSKDELPSPLYYKMAEKIDKF
jgi:ADP-ribose pyrophosphatase YjhB (NUDIX family)